MKVKLIKGGFMHNARFYNAGDDFEGDPEEIQNLARQGYCEDPNKPQGQQGQAQGPDPHEQPRYNQQAQQRSSGQ